MGNAPTAPRSQSRSQRPPNPGETLRQSRYERRVRHPIALVSLVIAALASASACTDPCRQLADRICNCELTAAQRQTCRADRIDSQANDPLRLGPTSDTAEQDVCIAALETCTCAALDENKTELCGYTKPDPTADTGDAE
jgi:hypothetical protein